MKCYLHIGTEKTGTTTIQEFLSINRKFLSENKYYYLKSLEIPNNRLLSVAAYNPDRRDDFTQRNNISSDEELIKIQGKIINNLKNEIKSLPPDSIVVCSNEHIHSRLTTIEELKRLKKILNSVGIEDITIIVYLKKPSEIANSLFSTVIKQGSTLHTIPPPYDTYFEQLCNHKKTIENFTSVFGQEKIIPRLFRKDKFVNNSLIEDISKIIGLHFNKASLTIPKNKNESLSLLGIMILRNLNEKFPAFISPETDNKRKELKKLISKHFSKPKFVMSKKTYQDYDTYFSNSNEWIRAKYFTEESELFTSEHPEASQTDITQNELNEITEFITEIWASRSRVLDNKWHQFSIKTNFQKLITPINFVLKKIRKATS